MRKVRRRFHFELPDDEQIRRFGYVHQRRAETQKQEPKINPNFPPVWAFSSYLPAMIAEGRFNELLNARWRMSLLGREDADQYIETNGTVKSAGISSTFVSHDCYSPLDAQMRLLTPDPAVGLSDATIAIVPQEAPIFSHPSEATNFAFHYEENPFVDSEESSPVHGVLLWSRDLLSSTEIDPLRLPRMRVALFGAYWSDPIQCPPNGSGTLAVPAILCHIG